MSELLNITEEQLREIKHIKKTYSETESVIKKCDIILYLHEGHSTKFITSKCGCSRSYVYIVRNQFYRHGTGWLWSTTSNPDTALYKSYLKPPVTSDTELTPSVRRELMNIFTDTAQSQAVRNRAYIILHVCDGVSMGVVARNIGKTVAYVESVCKKFANEGFDAIKPK